jgi:nucleoside-diphosphate-sugar epimerase
MDIRNVPKIILEDIYAVIHLAAISNDPMGNIYEKVTYDVNYRASIDLAKKALEMGVKKFVFSSSCSVYGFAEDEPRKENSPLNPLTAYAKSKVSTENDIEKLATNDFTVTSLRFSTACGMSDRLRLDLVLNDFVACAVTSKRISILSDGTPWRPLINVRDMALAMEWAIRRESIDGGKFLLVNVGSEEWNYQVRELAESVVKVIPGVDISINKDAIHDNRSYKVDFSLFKKLASGYQPKYNLLSTIKELREKMNEMEFEDKNFRESKFIRLNMLNYLREKNMLNDNLEWIDPKRKKLVL